MRKFWLGGFKWLSYYHLGGDNRQNLVFWPEVKCFLTSPKLPRITLSIHQRFWQTTVNHCQVDEGFGTQHYSKFPFLFHLNNDINTKGRLYRFFKWLHCNLNKAYVKALVYPSIQMSSLPVPILVFFSP